MGAGKKPNALPALPEGEPWTSYGALLLEKLSRKRYKHSLAVMERAVFLAEKNGADAGKARLAGLLHDIMKDMEHKKLLQFIEDSDILLTEEDRAAPQLWHAIGGAAYLKGELGIADKDVLNAVRYHTTGRAGMSLLEKVVYLADLTSADRDYPDFQKTCALADQNLDQALLYSMKFLICDLAGRGKLLHPDTLACYHELVGQGVTVA